MHRSNRVRVISQSIGFRSVQIRIEKIGRAWGTAQLALQICHEAAHQREEKWCVQEK